MSPPQETSDAPPQARSALRVLYLFAGAKRKADMRRFLLRMCHEKGITLRMTEVDILRSGRHDLSRRQNQVSYLRRARHGDYDTVIASTPPPGHSPAQGGRTARDLAQSGLPTAPVVSHGCLAQ